MKAKIYLAGPSRELERVRHWAAMLDRSGLFEFTHRWWLSYDQGGHVVGADALLLLDERKSIASNCMVAIVRADIVWALWPDTATSEGVPFETAYAIGRAIHIVCSSTRIAGSVFATAGHEAFDSDAAAFEDVLRWARLPEQWRRRT